MTELTKKVIVRKVKEYFNLDQVCGDDDSLNRWTIAPDINRPGLELSGYREEGELRRIVIIGNKERHYIDTLDYDTQVDRFEFLTDAYTPCIIITAGHKAPQALIDVASRKNFPVFETSEQTYQISSSLTSYLSEKLATSESYHGGVMSIYGVGVMITGDSGIGKSELALDLIKRGHIFVADDLVEISKVNNSLICESPDNLKKMLEVRGLGIIDVNVMFGAHCYLKKTKLDLVIKLVTYDEYQASNPDRLEITEPTMDILGIKRPVIVIPVTEGKSMSSIIETAVSTHIMKKQGVDTNKIFKKRILSEIESKE